MLNLIGWLIRSDVEFKAILLIAFGSGVAQPALFTFPHACLQGTRSEDNKNSQGKDKLLIPSPKLHHC